MVACSHESLLLETGATATLYSPHGRESTMAQSPGPIMSFLERLLANASTSGTSSSNIAAKGSSTRCLQALVQQELPKNQSKRLLVSCTVTEELSRLCHCYV